MFSGLIILIILIFLFLPTITFAICPLCTIAVGSGIGLSRYLGINDLITGIWIGGFIISSSFWFIDWLNKKKINFPAKKIIITGLFYLITFLFLFQAKLINHQKIILGIDKITLGIIVGSIIFLFSIWLDNWLRKINNNQVVFYYQKVIIPIFWLTIISFIFYLLNL